MERPKDIKNRFNDMKNKPLIQRIDLILYVIDNMMHPQYFVVIRQLWRSIDKIYLLQE